MTCAVMLGLKSWISRDSGMCVSGFLELGVGDWELGVGFNFGTGRSLPGRKNRDCTAPGVG